MDKSDWRPLLRAMAMSMLIGVPISAAAVPAPVLVYANSGADSAAGRTVDFRNAPVIVPAPFADAQSLSVGLPATAPYSTLSWSTAGTYGSLGALSTTAAIGTPTTNPDASFTLDLSFLDFVTALSRSGTLLAGTPVSLTLTLTVHGTDSYTSSTAYAAGNGAVSVSAGAGVGAAAASVSVSHAFQPVASTSDVFDRTITASTVVDIGQLFLISGDIDERVSTTLQLFGTADAATTTVDFLDGIEIFVTPTDPDVMLIASSGHDYALPSAMSVPEPPTPLLLLAAAVATARRRRRRPSA